MPRALVQAGEHVYPALVLGFPAPNVIGVSLVVAYTVGAQFQLALVPLVDALVGHAEGFPVFQANGVHQPQLFGLLGVHQRIACGEHAAGGMADHRGLLNAELFQQLMGVGRQLLEAVLVVVGLAGGAKTNLVRGDDAVTGVTERLDRTLPGSAAKILAVHQHHAAAVWSAGGGDVHVAHLQGFALGLEGKMIQRVGVCKALQLRAVGVS